VADHPPAASDAAAVVCAAVGCRRYPTFADDVAVVVGVPNGEGERCAKADHAAAVVRVLET